MHKKRHILFVITGLMGGGAEKALTNLLSVLDKTQYQIDALVVFADKLCDRKEPEIGYDTLFTDNRSVLYKIAKHLYTDLHVSFLLRMIIRHKILHSYDAIISFLEGDSLLYHSFIFDRGQKNITWVHTDFVDNHWSQRHFVGNDEQRAYEKVDSIVFVTKPAQQKFHKVFGDLSMHHEYICPNVIDIQDIELKAKELVTDVQKRKFTVCSVGRLEVVKGYDLLIDAAQILYKSNVDIDFWIIGTGSENNRLQQKIEDVHLEDMVHLLGYKTNPYPYMQMADVLISTSRAEGLPLFIAEACCLEKPIIATATIGAKEMLQNGMYGKLVDIEVNPIADAVLKFANDVYLREKYALAVKEAKKHYSIERVCKIFDQIVVS